VVRIAIVGAGVSGLVAAHLLHREHEIVLYEAGGYAGGHTNTIRVDTEHETHHVDTGFIVMNDRNYPNFTRLLDRLGVARQPTHMSFSVKGEEHDFEYSGTPRGLVCQPANLVSLRFQRMIFDLLRFTRALRALLEGDVEGGHSEESMQDFLSRHRFSRAFVERLIVPQLSAVWSADPRTAASFPARFIAEFFANHGMLGFRDRPQWATVAGGSARYVEALTYQPNEAVLHTDSTLLPRRRAARSAWNFHLLREPKPLSTVTYYMNHLQRLRADRDFCVTLNRTEAIDPAKIIRTIPYSHPMYTPRGVAAQREHASISNLSNRTHYCGAYWGWGFHEDGVVSALRACEPFGVKL